MRSKLFFVVTMLLLISVCAQAGEMQSAILMGDAQKVKALLEKNPGLVNQKDESGVMPLHQAVSMGKKEIVQLLLYYKADVNIKGEDGVTPLFMAVVMDNKDMVKFLMSKGADVNAKFEGEYTAAMMAQQLGRTEIVKILTGGKGLPADKTRSMYFAPSGNTHHPADPPPEPAPVRPKVNRKPGAPGTKAVTFEQKTVNGCPVNVISINLSDARVKVKAEVSSNGIGSDESFSSFIKRSKPVAAINGTFFSKADLRPIGDIVIDRELVYYGGMGTGLCVTDDCQVDFVKSRWAHHTDWSAYNTVVCCGPRLLKDGKIVVDAQAEGFRDPHVLGRANRTGAGTTLGNKLLFVNTKKGVSLREWAGIMKSLGCTEAINFDGGASMAMYYRGKTISTPGRKLTNVLLVYE